MAQYKDQAELEASLGAHNRAFAIQLGDFVSKTTQSCLNSLYLRIFTNRLAEGMSIEEIKPQIHHNSWYVDGRKNLFELMDYFSSSENVPEDVKEMPVGITHCQVRKFIIELMFSVAAKNPGNYPLHEQYAAVKAQFPHFDVDGTYIGGHRALAVAPIEGYDPQLEAALEASRQLPRREANPGEMSEEDFAKWLETQGEGAEADAGHYGDDLAAALKASAELSRIPKIAGPDGVEYSECSVPCLKGGKHDLSKVEGDMIVKMDLLSNCKHAFGHGKIIHDENGDIFDPAAHPAMAAEADEPRDNSGAMDEAQFQAWLLDKQAEAAANPPKKVVHDRVFWSGGWSMIDSVGPDKVDCTGKSIEEISEILGKEASFIYLH